MEASIESLSEDSNLHPPSAGIPMTPKMSRREHAAPTDQLTLGRLTRPPTDDHQEKLLPVSELHDGPSA